MRDVINELYKNIEEKEREGWDAFVKEHKGCFHFVSGNGIGIYLAADTVGGYVIVMKCLCGASENITNFDNW